MSTHSLLTRLEAAQPIIRRRDLYYRGQQPLRFMADKLNDKTMRFRSNLAKVAVGAVAERIRLEDVTARIVTVDMMGDRSEQDVSDIARDLVRDSDLPMTLQSVITDMLAVGSAYLIVWADDYGRPIVTGESAEQVIVERDPVTRGVTSAVKRWEVFDVNGVLVEEHVIKYTPDKIVHLVRDESRGKLKFIRDTPNHLGVVPVVPLINIERINDDTGMSVVDELAPLLDALNKIIVDMMVTSDSVARPKRYATGVVLEDNEDGFIADEDAGFIADDDDPVEQVIEALDPDDGVKSPFQDSDDLWISEQAEAKFGQLSGADLGGYKTAVELIMQQIMAVTSLPGHLVGVTTSNPSTAEALRASEVALASNADSRVRVINRPVEWAVRLLVAVEFGVHPDSVVVDLSWADTSTRSIAQEADAAVKLHSEGITSTTEARANVGAEKDL